jgi:hypothetical protein
MLEIESEVPLNNRILTKILQEEADYSKWAELDGERGDDGGSSSGEEEATELKPHGAAVDGGGGDHAEIGPAALVKILVQVLPQTEASEESSRVGMKRDNPNRNPVLTFPKTGRNWQYALPTAVNIIERGISAVNTGKRRVCYTMILVVIIGIIALLHYIPNPQAPACGIIQASCTSTSTCAACACCNDRSRNEKTYCFYRFLGSSSCEREPYLTACNMLSSTCELQTPLGCIRAAAGVGGSCQNEPQDKVANVNVATR